MWILFHISTLLNRVLIYLNLPLTKYSGKAVKGSYTYSVNSGFLLYLRPKQGPKFVSVLSNSILLTNMKQTVQRDLRTSRPSRRNRVSFDQTTALGGLTMALFAYILYYFIYPMIAKGLLW